MISRKRVMRSTAKVTKAKHSKIKVKVLEPPKIGKTKGGFVGESITSVTAYRTEPPKTNKENRLCTTEYYNEKPSSSSIFKEINLHYKKTNEFREFSESVRLTCLDKTCRSKMKSCVQRIKTFVDNINNIATYGNAEFDNTVASSPKSQAIADTLALIINRRPHISPLFNDSYRPYRMNSADFSPNFIESLDMQIEEMLQPTAPELGEPSPLRFYPRRLY